RLSLTATLFPYTPLFRSATGAVLLGFGLGADRVGHVQVLAAVGHEDVVAAEGDHRAGRRPEAVGLDPVADLEGRRGRHLGLPVPSAGLSPAVPTNIYASYRARKPVAAREMAERRGFWAAPETVTITTPLVDRRTGRGGGGR